MRPDSTSEESEIGSEERLWTYLEKSSHKWKKQLFLRNSKIAAATVWTTALANNQSVEEAACNWQLPPAAVHEIFNYCESNQALIQTEAAEELRRLDAVLSQHSQQ